MNDYFCIQPFFGYEYRPDGGTHCCLLPKDYNIEELRQDILNSKRSKFCTACWKLEDAGLISDRKIKNSTLDFYWDRDLRYIEEDVRKGLYSPITIRIQTSTKCNATCVSCGPRYSSAWASLEKKLTSVTIPIARINQNRIDQLDFSNLLSIGFTGGEPLYEKTNFHILEKLIEHNNTNCFISFTTNGSISVSVEHKKLLAKFKNLNIGLSIDGVGPVFEYLRFPLKWDKLLENLEFFRTITDNISANYTTNNLNVLYHHETVAWFSQQKLPYHFNPIINPSYLRPSALPKNIKEEIFKKYGHTKDLDFFLGQHTEQDDRDFETLLGKLQQQDAAKGIKMQDYLIELYNLLKEYCQLVDLNESKLLR